MNIEQAMLVVGRGGHFRAPTWDPDSLYAHIANMAVLGPPKLCVCVRLRTGEDTPISLNGYDLLRDDFREVDACDVPDRMTMIVAWARHCCGAENPHDTWRRRHR